MTQNQGNPSPKTPREIFKAEFFCRYKRLLLLGFSFLSLLTCPVALSAAPHLGARLPTNNTELSSLPVSEVSDAIFSALLSAPENAQSYCKAVQSPSLERRQAAVGAGFAAAYLEFSESNRPHEAAVVAQSACGCGSGQSSVRESFIAGGGLCDVHTKSSLPPSPSPRGYFSQSSLAVSDAERREMLDPSSRDGFGISSGALTFLPMMRVEAVYESRNSANPAASQESAGLGLSSRLEIRAQKADHEVTASIEMDRLGFVTAPSRTNALASLSGRWDLGSEWIISGGGQGGVFSLAPGDFDATPGAKDPTQGAEMTLWGSAQKTFGRFTTSLGGSYTTVDYDDVASLAGGVLDQQRRDRHVWILGGRTSYDLSPEFFGSTQIFGDLRGQFRDHDGTTTAPLLNTQGARILGGISFQIKTLLLEGDLGIGYLSQGYRDPLRQSQSAFAYAAHLLWTPSPSLRARLSADRSFEDSPLVNSDGRLVDRLALGVDYTALPDLVLSPSLALAYGQEAMSAERETAYTLGLKAEYAWSHLWSFGARYEYTTLLDSSNALPWEANRHLVGVYAQARY